MFNWFASDGGNPNNYPHKSELVEPSVHCLNKMLILINEHDEGVNTET